MFITADKIGSRLGNQQQRVKLLVDMKVGGYPGKAGDEVNLSRGDAAYLKGCGSVEFVSESATAPKSAIR